MSQPSDAEHEWWRVDLVLQTILCPVRFGENITECSGMLIPSGEHIQESSCHNQSGNPPPGHHHNELVTLAKCWTSRSCHSFIRKTHKKWPFTRGSRLLKASSLAKEHGSCSAWDQPTWLSQLQESQDFLLVK